MARWTKEQRAHAKANGLALIAIAVDGRTLAEGKFGMMELTAPEDRATAEQVMAFMTQLLKKRSKKLKATKEEK